MNSPKIAGRNLRAIRNKLKKGLGFFGFKTRKKVYVNPDIIIREFDENEIYEPVR